MPPSLHPEANNMLAEGLCIPAHPLALTADGELDEVRQNALTRYYLEAGAGGLAVGVHTTQFGIRKVGLLEPVLRLAVTSARALERRVVLVAGVCGETKQATYEAEMAAALGYDIALVSLSDLAMSTGDLVRHVAAVGEILPVMGFYLQPAAGGRPLDYTFWRSLAELECLAAVKIAPFNRYATVDVVRAVADSERWSEIALYTGNDDNFLVDLLTVYEVTRPGGEKVRLPIVGSLLGQNAVWFKRALEIFQLVRDARSDGVVSAELLTLAGQLTDANGAIFDVAGGFVGCITGIHEVLRRQGLLEHVRLLDPSACLSPAQSAELDRVLAAYPHLADDAFVENHLEKWLRVDGRDQRRQPFDQSDQAGSYGGGYAKRPY